jgi:hypothetical protein
VPVPSVVIPPGIRVKVQDPIEGKSLNTTLPVDTEQVGCVMAPIVGAVGCPHPFAETNKKRATKRNNLDTLNPLRL